METLSCNKITLAMHESKPPLLCGTWPHLLSEEQYAREFIQKKNIRKLKESPY